MSPRRKSPAPATQPELAMEPWQQVTVPKVRRAGPPPLGQRAFHKDGRPRKFTQAEREQMVRGAARGAHARCVDHVRIDGLSTPVCILRGQDRDLILASARELIGEGE